MEEIELVQKKLLKALAEETEKENKDKTLISQLSKTIIDTSKLLADYGFAPPLVTKIFDLISKNFSAQRNQGYEDIKRIRMLREHVIGIKLDNEDQYDGNKEDSLTEENDPNAVF